ncbi:MAG: prenyltransferase, partial [Kutzneria sp.]|nr:prenyltransferase [Kutzneria sp.]
MSSCDLGVEETAVALEPLLSDMWSDEHGLTSPSVYETARVVRLAPWLTGHAQRVRFLVDSQRPDGCWGGNDGYGLVPTLSATEALLSGVLCRRRSPCRPEESPYGPEVVRAADRGLRVLFSWLNTGKKVRLPDTVAVELVVPALVEEINVHLGRLDTQPSVGLDRWRGTARLAVPDGAHAQTLERLRAMVRGGHGLPDKLWHTLEIIGAPVRRAGFVRPVNGVVGCSPASTAAWLGEPPVGADDACLAYLREVQARHAGPVPVAAPVTLFERAWVLTALTTAGVVVSLPEASVAALHDAFGEFGAAVGPGLMPDADDTATALYALAQLGSPRSPDCLFEYRTGRHFSCFPAERTPSVSTNAHVLQAFGACLAPWSDKRSRYLAVMSDLTEWLVDCQESDGSWRDKWHASPYYATSCCVAALAGHGGVMVQSALREAMAWVLGTQRPDGSWGRWTGTYEETAYAMQILLRACGPARSDAVKRAVARGGLFLLRPGADREHPPLWHDKDLYT